MPEYNARIKYYPRANNRVPAEIIVFRRQRFNPEKEQIELDEMAKSTEKRTENGIIPLSDVIPGAIDMCSFSAENCIRNYRIAHRRLYDLIASNPQLNMFITLTFAPENVDRCNYDDIIKRLNVWLSNRVQRNGMSYIIVPEYHHDGKAIHFHGLIKDSTLKLENSHHKKDGKTIYNIKDFPFGFTTAIRITNPQGAEATDCIAKYISKYMSKCIKEYNERAISEDGFWNTPSGKLKIGGRYYLSGGELNRPIYAYAQIPYEIAESKEMTITGLNEQYKLLKPTDGKAFELLKDAYFNTPETPFNSLGLLNES